MNTQPKHKDSPNSTLDWIESSTPVPGYKASTKYPGWMWRKKNETPKVYDLPVLSPVETYEVKDVDGETTEIVKRYVFVVSEIPTDDNPPSDLTGLSPDYSHPYFTGEADEMIEELLSADGVMIIPGEDGGYEGSYRLSDNPSWYKKMYREGYESRDTCLNALARIVEGRYTPGQYKYVDRLLDEITTRLHLKADISPELQSLLRRSLI